MDRRRRAGRTLLLGGLLWAVAAAAAGPASAADDEGLVWQAFVHERDVESITPGRPLELDWQEPAVVDLRVTNERDEPVSISRVRFEGRVLGLAFFAFTTDVDLELAPGDDDQRVYSLNMQDLYGQATGLLPGRVVLLDGRDEVADLDVPVRVRAPLRSVYGMFGLGVGAVTLVLLWGALWSLARGRLHANRWRRATSLAVPGLGLGFTLTFTVSALGWFLPSAALWLGLVLACGATGFAVGYLTPTPDVAEDDDLDEDAVADDDVDGYGYGFGGPDGGGPDAPTAEDPSVTDQTATRDRLASGPDAPAGQDAVPGAGDRAGADPAWYDDRWPR